MSDADKEILTIEEVKRVFESVLAERLGNVVTHDDLAVFRREVDQKIDAQEKRNIQREQSLKTFVEHAKSTLTDFVQTQTLKFESQSKENNASLKQLTDAVNANRALEDSRNETAQQLASQVQNNTLAMQTVQSLANGNASALRTTENELGDVLIRLTPLTYEVYGNKDTGKLPLRQEFESRHTEIMNVLKSVTGNLEDAAKRLGGVEDGMAAIDRRHADEDKWLRERPRAFKNAMVKVGTQVFASSIVKWSIILLGGTGAGALLIEILEALLGG